LTRLGRLAQNFPAAGDTKPGTTTLPPVIAAMNAQINIDYSVIAASGCSGRSAVILALVFQRCLVQGLTAGSVKG
jgi:ABC-type glycerol-3-phosphate transport system permease component